MASIGNFFRRSLRRSGRRGESREGTPGSTARRRARGGAGAGAGAGVGVGVGAGTGTGAPGPRLREPTTAGGAGTLPGSAARPRRVGPTVRAPAPAPAPSPPALPRGTRSPCGAQLGPSAPGSYRISGGLLHPQGLTPAPGSALHLPGAHPSPWGFSPSRELHPKPWEPTPSQRSLPHPLAPHYHVPQSFPSTAMPERGIEGIRGGTVPLRQVSVAEPLEDGAEIGPLGFVSFSEIEDGLPGFSGLPYLKPQ